MKRMLAKAAVILLLAAVFPVRLGAQKVHIVAHRGFWKAESAGGARNSSASLKAAQDNCFWGSEFDVQLTSDGVAMINHDPVIATPSDTFRIDSRKWKQMRKLTLENGERRPSMDEYAALGAQGPDTRMVVELKKQKEAPGSHEREDLLLEQTVTALRKHGIFTPDRTVFISFSLYLCEQIARKYPGFTNQYLSGDLSPAEVNALGINGIDYHFNVFRKNPSWVREAHDLGMSVNAWTANKPEDIEAMLDLGVDYITTDEPLRVKKILDKRGDFQVEASELTLVGKLFPDTPNPYERLDTLVYGGLAQKEIKRALMASGISVAFKTDSRRITVQTVYKERGEALKSAPQAYAGYDLFIRKDGEWVWAGSGVGSNSDPEAPVEIIKAMDGTMHECLLYLPLYSILESVKIGIDGGAEISAMENPFRHKVAVFGSSFTHGAGTTRPGMAYPAIFSRDTGIQILSLGVSGQSKLQMGFAKALAGAEMDALVLDAFSNPSVETIEERLFPFIETVQAAHPDIPIIFQTTIYREWRNFNTRFMAFEEARYNRSVELVKEAQKKYRNIYLVYPDASTPDHDTTSDGTHPNDYGYVLWAHSIEKPILKILKKYGIK